MRVGAGRRYCSERALALDLNLHLESIYARSPQVVIEGMPSFEGLRAEVIQARSFAVWLWRFGLVRMLCVGNGEAKHHHCGSAKDE